MMSRQRGVIEIHKCPVPEGVTNDPTKGQVETDVLVGTRSINACGLQGPGHRCQQQYAGQGIHVMRNPLAIDVQYQGLQDVGGQ